MKDADIRFIGRMVMAALEDFGYNSRTNVEPCDEKKCFFDTAKWYERDGDDTKLKRFIKDKWL